MQTVARIACDRGALYLAASTPYERELVLEHCGQYARRHRRAHLQLDRRHWLITAPTAAPAVICQRCHEQERWLAFTEGKRTLCQACAREDIRSAGEITRQQTPTGVAGVLDHYATRR